MRSDGEKEEEEKDSSEEDDGDDPPAADNGDGGAAPPLTRARDADNLAVLLLCALCVGFAMAARLSRRPSEHALALAPYLAMAAGTAHGHGHGHSRP